MNEGTVNEIRRLCQHVLAYHTELVTIAKDRTHGSMVKSDKLDRMYQAMVTQARRVEELLDDE